MLFVVGDRLTPILVLSGKRAKADLKNGNPVHIEFKRTSHQYSTKYERTMRSIHCYAEMLFLRSNVAPKYGLQRVK